jgi:hypothetical protein
MKGVGVNKTLWVNNIAYLGNSNEGELKRGEAPLIKYFPLPLAKGKGD